MNFIEVRDLKVHFAIKKGILGRTASYVKAVDGVSLSLEKGKTYGLVGESGSGKTTTGRAIIGLHEITSGRVLFDGQDITNKGLKNKEIQKNIQMIFQDPYGSLNPRKKVIDIIAEPIKNFERLSHQEIKRRVGHLLELVNLSVDSMWKYPHEFSGGQRQRIGIARAIAPKPKLIIADEPVSALDVSVQAQVLNFMQDIQKEFQLTYLFICHDLSIVKHICDDIGILYKGKLVEVGTKDDIFQHPQHIYTKRLLAAIPNADPRQRKEQLQRRREVAQRYANARANFDGDAVDSELRAISDTHSVAIPRQDWNGGAR